MTPGRYRHWKGTVYEVLGIVVHTETHEELVYYRSPDGKLWARPREMFEGFRGDGKRFTYIGPLINLPSLQELFTNFEEPTSRSDLSAGLQVDLGPLLDCIRARGWRVAAHNDYERDGNYVSAWLLTDGRGKYARGDASSDLKALEIAFEKVRAMEET